MTDEFLDQHRDEHTSRIKDVWLHDDRRPIPDRGFLDRMCAVLVYPDAGADAAYYAGATQTTLDRDTLVDGTSISVPGGLTYGPGPDGWVAFKLDNAADVCYGENGDILPGAPRRKAERADRARQGERVAYSAWTLGDVIRRVNQFGHDLAEQEQKAIIVGSAPMPPATTAARTGRSLARDVNDATAAITDAAADIQDALPDFSTGGVTTFHGPDENVERDTVRFGNGNMITRTETDDDDDE